MTDAQETEGASVIVLVGDVDLDAVAPLREAVDQAIADRVPHVIFDLSAVTFLDSTALALFAYAAQHCGVTLRAPSESTCRLLEITGLDAVLEVER
jgi:anti-sigma B factor antagonist